MVARNVRYSIYIFAFYALSWFLPIWKDSSALGYDGAGIAHDYLVMGFEMLNATAAGFEPFGADILVGAVQAIVYGSVNVLFVLAFLYRLKGSDTAYYLSAPCVVIMIGWSGMHRVPNHIAYYIWLGSGVWLFVLSADAYRKRRGFRPTRLLVDKSAFAAYAVALVIGLGQVLRALNT